MKKNNIKPTGLKGQEKVNRMIELMGQTLIKEGVDRSVIELTKVGPDGKSYGIVRENHEYYIKIAEGTENLTKDSFNYIGGLKNKKEFAYPSYAKAIKHLNYKFKSLDEANGTKSNINVFENDSLVGEHHSIAMDKAFSDTKPMSKDIEKEYIVDKTGEEEEEEGVKKNLAEGVMDDLMTSAKNGTLGADIETIVQTNGKHAVKRAMVNLMDSGAIDREGMRKIDMMGRINRMDELEDVKLSETEKRIDQMITGDVEPDVIVSEGDVTVSKPLSILRGIEVIDDAIAKATGEYKLDEMATATELLKKFSKDEVMSILEDVTGKKKV